MGTPFRIFILLGAFFLLASVDKFYMFPFPIVVGMSGGNTAWMYGTFIDSFSLLLASAAVAWALLSLYIPMELTMWLLKNRAIARLWKLTMIVVLLGPFWFSIFSFYEAFVPFLLTFWLPEGVQWLKKKYTLQLTWRLPSLILSVWTFLMFLLMVQCVGLIFPGLILSVDILLEEKWKIPGYQKIFPTTGDIPTLFIATGVLFFALAAYVKIAEWRKKRRGVIQD
jgi:hypothetical protein